MLSEVRVDELIDVFQVRLKQCHILCLTLIKIYFLPGPLRGSEDNLRDKLWP